MKTFLTSFLLIPILIFASCTESEKNPNDVQISTVAEKEALASESSDTMEYEVTKSEEEWREQLSGSEYRILRKRGTELPYVNKYYDNEKEGVYYCRACGQPLFTSETKYKSGTGWPSFWDPIKPSVVGEQEDNSLFMTRTETVCARCGSHLGHVFEDGPQPTGLRYCLNSLALDFKEMDLSSVDTDTLSILNK